MLSDSARKLFDREVVENKMDNELVRINISGSFEEFTANSLLL
jgi:hypothetical protein